MEVVAPDLIEENSLEPEETPVPETEKPETPPQGDGYFQSERERELAQRFAAMGYQRAMDEFAAQRAQQPQEQPVTPSDPMLEVKKAFAENYENVLRKAKQNGNHIDVAFHLYDQAVKSAVGLSRAAILKEIQPLLEDRLASRDFFDSNPDLRAVEGEIRAIVDAGVPLETAIKLVNHGKGNVVGTLQQAASVNPYLQQFLAEPEARVAPRIAPEIEDLHKKIILAERKGDKGARDKLIAGRWKVRQ